MPSRSSQTLDSVAGWLIANRWYLLIIILVVAAGAWILKDKATFDNSIEGMFAAGDERLQEYQRLKQIFGGAELVLVVYDDPDLFADDGSGLERLTVRAARIAEVADVTGVLSLAEINGALKRVYSLGNLLPSNEQWQPVMDPDDELAVRFLNTFENYTHGKDRRTAAIVGLLAPAEKSTRSRAELIHDLRDISHDWTSSQVTGEPVLVVDGFRFLRRDARQLDRRCLLLMGAVILLCFRSVRWLLIPLAIIQFSLWMTLSLLGIVDWRMTMVSSMMSALLSVISVATIVHIIVRFREERLSRGRDRESALRHSLAALLLPITWTCLTTAAGFLGLTLAKVEPVADFGWMMVFGSLFVLVNVVFLVPGLALLGEWDADPQSTWGERLLETGLSLSSGVISRRPWIVGSVLMAVMVVLAMGMTRLKVETDFTRNFRSDSEIIQAYRFVEDRLGGAGMMDVVIRAPEKLDRKFLQRVDALQDELRNLRLSSDPDEPALTHVVSFADADRIVRSKPVLAMVTPEIRFRAMSEVMPGFAAQMRTMEPDENGDRWFRIMLRTYQQKSAEAQTELVRRVNEIVTRAFPETEANETQDAMVAGSQPERRETMTTGFFVLLSSLVQSVLSDQSKTFVAACVFIALVMLAAFHSPRLVIIAMIPNILPIAALLGTLGWLGIKMNMGSAMIAAVSLGLSIDGTIHYLTSYRHHRMAGMSIAAAVHRVQLRTGRAVIYATIALVIGFGSLCFSEFIPTVFFGSLVSLSMLGGLLANLLVLPVLLTLLDRRDTPEPEAQRPHRRQITEHENSSHDETDA